MKLTKDDFDIGYVGQWESCDDFFVGVQWLKSEKEGEDIRDQILKNQEDAETLKVLNEIKQTISPKCYEYERIVERLKKFFNQDNVLTKSEYKQKILEGKK